MNAERGVHNLLGNGVFGRGDLAYIQSLAKSAEPRSTIRRDGPLHVVGLFHNHAHLGRPARQRLRSSLARVSENILQDCHYH